MRAARPLSPDDPKARCSAPGLLLGAASRARRRYAGNLIHRLGAGGIMGGQSKTTGPVLSMSSGCDPGKKNAGPRGPAVIRFCHMRGEITFQRGTAGRIIRRWEEVATKQTNSLLLICSAQRAYARSTLAGLLCIFRKAVASALRKGSCRPDIVPGWRAKCLISRQCGSLSQLLRAAGCGSGNADACCVGIRNVRRIARKDARMTAWRGALRPVSQFCGAARTGRAASLAQ